MITLLNSYDLSDVFILLIMKLKCNGIINKKVAHALCQIFTQTRQKTVYTPVCSNSQPSYKF